MQPAAPIRILLFLLTAAPALAQNAPWTGMLRGSWLQTGPAAAGDVTLVSAAGAIEIVVGPAEASNVRQAAEFLAGDIASIAGTRPALVNTPSAGKGAIHLVTLGRGDLPAGIDASAMRGQWESYRILTRGRDVWLIGSNPRGTAFAAYTL